MIVQSCGAHLISQRRWPAERRCSIFRPSHLCSERRGSGARRAPWRCAKHSPICPIRGPYDPTSSRSSCWPMFPHNDTMAPVLNGASPPPRPPPTQPQVAQLPSRPQAHPPAAQFPATRRPAPARPPAVRRAGPSPTLPPPAAHLRSLSGGPCSNEAWIPKRPRRVLPMPPCGGLCWPRPSEPAPAAVSHWGRTPVVHRGERVVKVRKILKRRRVGYFQHQGAR